MPTAETDRPQPWAGREDGFPINRAFLRELVDELDKRETAREERLRDFLTWLSVRWAIIWLAIGVVGWVLFSLAKAMAGY